ncbi:caspase family protein [Kamptonema formosum]|uniref:caspase family protein n=1 Tax=Kamptonema formosum TaxID=331992 RepID=UPI00034496B1|nr:caspase family protein [Oscillatoria sp. PCC 10802]
MRGEAQGWVPAAGAGGIAGILKTRGGVENNQPRVNLDISKGKVSMQRDALVVGINRYPFLKKLPISDAQHLTAAAADAEAVARLLETHGNFTVRRFPNSLIDGKLQVDPKALMTAEELEKEIARLFNPNTGSPPDAALLYFAGHGLRREVTGGVTEGYLATSDAGPRKEKWGVSLQWLRQLLKKSPVRQQIVWLDCCRSGELFNFATEDLQVADSEKVRFFIAAARDFEDAHSNLTGERGALTEILLDGLDPSAKGAVTSVSLTKFINRQLLLVPQKPIIHCDKRPLIYLTATPEKRHLLEKRLGSGPVSPDSGRILSRREYLNRQGLLSQVKNEVDSRLEHSLHNAVLINLGKEKQPQQVQRPWDVEVKVGNQSPVALPQRTEIIDVFDDETIAGKLLILGAPGSGKTTTLLELARELVERAGLDANQPVPVLFNLSSWKDDKQTIAEWLVAELKDKYRVRQDIGQKWLAGGELLPLLDGLDELASERQEKCVREINRFIGSEVQSRHLVVCSRREEYEQYETQLELNGAICLQSLTEAQIQKYLEGAGRSELWPSIEADFQLLELAKFPLLLAIITLALAGEELSVEEWHKCSSAETRRRYLFDAYIAQMLRRKIKAQWYAKGKEPREANIKNWLTCLAKRLTEDSQTEFLIERMQPAAWLPATWRDRQIYALGVGGILGLIAGAVFALFYLFPLITFLPFPLLIKTPAGRIAIFASLFIGICFGLIFWLLFYLTFGQEKKINL